jgi:hypothetical protein
MIGYIYKTTNNINGWLYIGQHLNTKFNKNYKGSGIRIKEAFRQYGYENFTTKIIDTANTIEELNKKEKHYIRLHKMLPNCYNVAKGGEGSKWIYVDLENKRIFYSLEELSDYTKYSISTLLKYINKFDVGVRGRKINGRLHWISKRFAQIPSSFEGKIKRGML